MNTNFSHSAKSAIHSIKLLSHAYQFSRQVTTNIFILDRLFRYFVKYLNHLPRSYDYSLFLEQPHLLQVSNYTREIFLRIYRPYLQKSFNFLQKYRAITSHYRFFSDKFPITKVIPFCKNGILLNQMSIPSMGSFQIIMKMAKWEEEGEFELVIRDEKNAQTLYRLTFTVIAWRDGSGTIYIGGLQGKKMPDMKQITHDLTKNMFGLRPKNLLLFCLREICAFLEIKYLYAVCNAEQISNNHQKSFHADYDQFWKECGAVWFAKNCYFSLPTRNIFRSEETIKPKKRSLYRKRYSWLENLKKELHQNLQDSLSL